jgi:RHH-type transcriptional regulator, proline utilization regulon repressor / proline dehydrogenase / delta 1-pyrroline-5-carboxylate dehydrogenase
MTAPNYPVDIADLPERAVTLAAELLDASRPRETAQERAHSAKMARMMRDASGKKFTIAMVDQILRIPRPALAVKRLGGLLSQYGLPRYLGTWDRILLRFGSLAARIAPGFVLPLIKGKVRGESAHVIISAEPDRFAAYLKARESNQIRINFNQLGEAVLGDQEARRRLESYLRRLAEPEIRYVSVKLSSVVSQISLTGYDSTVREIREALREIYRVAVRSSPDRPKFVNLDMEEYRDLYLTVDVFQSVLDEPEFERLEAGIVLQAYLPDSFEVLKSLVDWARKRHARTGARIKVRLVKGANLAMEQVEASLEDWPQAPYQTKLESDANYKRMMEFACRPENAAVARVGIASHNLFDIAYALLVRERRGVQSQVEFEMLEGMANAQALEVRRRSGDLVIYTPACYDAEFDSAVAYLVRRFDENTQEGSFLGALFALKEGSPEWKEQSRVFLDACRLASDPGLNSRPNRKQDRAKQFVRASNEGTLFHNSPNTDFSIPANRDWIREIARNWSSRTIDTIPIQVGGRERTTEHLRDGSDPSRPGIVAYRFARGDRNDLEEALACAEKARHEWEAIGVRGRAAVLREIAAVFERQRGETIGAMMLDAGKAAREADIEVTEAIDFAEYYSRSLDEPGWLDGTAFRAAGTVAVTPPWNFPYAIPAGGVLAALMAGNAVILKPASETVLTAWMLAKQCWDAGVPRSVLQFLPLKDGETGKALITDPRVRIVILTGGYSTAQMFQSWRPDLRLYAETSGKNSMIITASADVDLAIKDLVRGAFGHAGQKCSATSLALIQREICESPKFRHQLRDAAQSLKVGPSWNLASSVTPVIREPSGELKQGLTRLEPGEEWLLEPTMIDNNPCLWSPGIILGVKPGSWYHKTECFGPVLGLISVADFDEALRIQNSSEFGLTGGLHSLDPEEIRVWRDKVEVGNAYINRTTTGAIVRRQPFGGWKHSCVGPGAKAGGPNYVSAMCDWRENGKPSLSSPLSGSIRELVEKLKSSLSRNEDREALSLAAGSYMHWWEKHFSVAHDPSQLHGETNHFRYRPRPFHLFRAQALSTEEAVALPLAIARVAVACALAGVELRISVDRDYPSIAALAAVTNASYRVETSEALASTTSTESSGSFRVSGSFTPEELGPSWIGNLAPARREVLANGRVELLNYLREQSMTEIVHRYGNIV